MISRASVSVQGTMVLALLLMQSIVHADSGIERPNIVLVMCDDLGWGDVGFNGNTQIRTPNLDAMSSNSLRLTRFYAQAPVCSPTRGSCLTGRHPYRYGIPGANSGHMKAEELTLAELVKKLGYRTGHFGKWHLGTLTTTVKDSNRGGPKNKQHFSPPQANGFDVCFSTEAKVPTYDPMLKPEEKAGNAWDAIEDKSSGLPYGTYYWNERGERVTDNLLGDDSRIIMDRAIPFIRTAAKNKTPFFAIVWFHTPHLPVVADKAHRDMYPDATSVRARNYFGCISAMDEQIGRLRETLRDLGIANDTLLTFCSDNGPEGNQNDPGSAGPFRGRKRSLYEGGIRVPALIEWPKNIAPGSTTSFPAVTSDYLPTIVDYLGAKLENDHPLDGRSLRGVFENNTQKRQQAIGFQSSGQGALSDDQFKIYRSKKSRDWELYDLLADPGESQDLASKHPEIVARMASEFEHWQASCAASNEGADYK